MENLLIGLDRPAINKADVTSSDVHLWHRVYVIHICKVFNIMLQDLLFYQK